MYIVTPKQMKAAEEMTDKSGVSYFELMENAGAAATAEIIKRLDVSGKKALVLCGKGNNGGDGYVIARHLAGKGAFVTVAITAEKPQTGIAFDEYNRICGNKNIKIQPLSETELQGCDIIVDAVFGTGFHGELPDDIKKAFREISSTDAFRLAVDIPSGADSISGKCSDDVPYFDVTVTFGAIKAGMLHMPARKHCGEIVTADIGITDETLEKSGGIELMDDMTAAMSVPERGEMCHKGCFGKLLIIAGSDSMSGAAAMNVTGALRSGAGLVRLASVPKVIDRVGSGIYECTFTELKPNADGGISAENIPELSELISKMTCVSLGSGMGMCEDSIKITESIVKICGEKNIPLIIDADGLNCLAGRIDIIRNANCRAVLTPHPAELGRLLGISSAEVLADRQAMAKKLAELTGAVVCAKGYPTYIVSPDGRTRASFTGNGGLSRGGSGDVLTGIISGLVSSNRCDLPENGDKLFEAASAGVYIFGAAADIAADVLSKTGMLPTDAAMALPDVFARLGK